MISFVQLISHSLIHRATDGQAEEQRNNRQRDKHNGLERQKVRVSGAEKSEKKHIHRAVHTHTHTNTVILNHSGG